MRLFAHQDSIVRKIWGSSDTILFVFAGSAAEFALNKSVDWLYFTGRLPADPIGRLFSTVDYARKIVFAPSDEANAVIDQISKIHQGVEKSRGFAIPDEAYRDVLYMLIHYSIAAFELLERKLTEGEKDEVYDVFLRMGKRMQLKNLPDTYKSWMQDRELHMHEHLRRSDLTDNLFQQYKKHLGNSRYRILIEAQKLVVPKHVHALLGFSRTTWLKPTVPLYRFSKKLGLHGPIRNVLLPNQYRARIDALDVLPELR